MKILKKLFTSSLLLAFLIIFAGCKKENPSPSPSPQPGGGGGVGSTTTNYNVTNSGSSNYIFNGGSFTNANNPTLTLQRGKTYTFTLNVPGHPFYIKTTQTTGSGNAFNTGVTNNGASSGTVTFVVPTSAPNTLYYICEFHSPMTGTINITN